MTPGAAVSGGQPGHSAAPASPQGTPQRRKDPPAASGSVLSTRLPVGGSYEEPRAQPSSPMPSRLSSAWTGHKPGLTSGRGQQGQAPSRGPSLALGSAQLPLRPVPAPPAGWVPLPARSPVLQRPALPLSRGTGSGCWPEHPRTVPSWPCRPPDCLGGGPGRGRPQVCQGPLCVSVMGGHAHSQGLLGKPWSLTCLYLD